MDKGQVMQLIKDAIPKTRSKISVELMAEVLDKLSADGNFDNLRSTARGERGIFGITSIAWAEAARLASLRGVSLKPFQHGWRLSDENATAAVLLFDNAANLLTRNKLTVNAVNVFEVFKYGWRNFKRRRGIVSTVSKPAGGDMPSSSSEPSVIDKIAAWFKGGSEPVGDNSREKEFIKEFWPAFKKHLGAAAPYAFAHAANESAWGTRRAGTRYNIFGIKADTYRAAKAGPVVGTDEVYGGKTAREQTRFADFDSVDEAVIAYRDLLSNPKRRLSKFKPLEASNAKDFGERLAKAGYFTDPAGASKIAAMHRDIFAA